MPSRTLCGEDAGTTPQMQETWRTRSRHGGDQNHSCPQPPCEIEAAFAVESDIDEHDCRLELLLESQGVCARRCRADDRDPLSLEQHTRGTQEGKHCH
jgi:hypothetical protein